VGYVSDIILGAGGSLVAAELWAHADPLSRFFIRRATFHLPVEQRARREEEWLAHLDETPGAVRKLMHAIGCWAAAPAVGRAGANRVGQRARMVPGPMLTMFKMSVGTARTDVREWIAAVCGMVGVVLGVNVGLWAERSENGAVYAVVLSICALGSYLAWRRLRAALRRHG
jgi:hypothetical protein